MKGMLTQEAPSGTFLPPPLLAELKWIQGPRVQPASCLFPFHEKDPVPRSKEVWENALDSRLREGVLIQRKASSLDDAKRAAIH